MLDPYGPADILEGRIKARGLVSHNERKRLIYGRFLEFCTAIEHKRIEVVFGESLLIFGEFIENFDIHTRACSHGRSYRLGVAGIGGCLSYDGNFGNAESQAAPYDRSQVAAVGRIYEDHVVAVTDLYGLLLNDNYHEAVVFFREDIKRLLFRGYRNVTAADGPDLLDRFLRSEARMKDHSPYNVPLFKQVFHCNGCAQAICVYIVAFVTGNFNQNVLFLSNIYMIL